MDKYQIIGKFRKENLSEKKGCNCKKKEDFQPLEKGPDDPCWENYVQVGTKIVDGKEVPNCVPLEAAKVKEGFPIPSPEGGEDEQAFISRCMSNLNEEFPDEKQRAAVCYKAWRGE